MVLSSTRLAREINEKWFKRSVMALSVYSFIVYSQKYGSLMVLYLN